jgi:hypothetical protein
MKRHLAIGIVVASLFVCASAARTDGAPDAVMSPLATKDRLTDDDRRALVSGPLAAFLDGRVDQAQADFETLLASRAGGDHAHAVALADTLSSMGVELYTAAPDDEADLKTRAMDYMRRAIPATIAAFGERDPEAALAMSDYVVAETNEHPKDPPADVDAYAQQAYAIRLAALGPRNDETIDALEAWAKIEGLASRTHGDRALGDAAAHRLEQAIDLRRAINTYGAAYEAESYIAVATIYAANHDLEQAKERFAKAEAVERDGDPSARTGYLVKVMDFVGALDENGFKPEAAAIRARYGQEWAAFLAGLRAAAPPGQQAPYTITCGAKGGPC